MKVCSKCKEEKDLLLFSISRSMKDGYQYKCKACTKLYRSIYYQTNKVHIAAKNKEWVKNNPERVNLSHSRWKAANPDKVCAKNAKRRASKLQAMPAWANQKAIKSWYKLAKMFDKTFGEKHHVDHIIPLNGKNICGLHVEYNLQVLTATENLRKGARYEA